MDLEEDKLLVRIAEMYYQEDKNQSQISKELNIHRTTISRLLKRSREEGVVQILINYDMAGTYSLEKRLEERFNLKKAIVIPAAPDMKRQQKDQLLAQGLADFLPKILKNNMNIGFSWGQTMGAVSNAFPELSLNNITCIPMIGGPSGRLISDYHVNTITYEAAKKLHGKALLIDSPGIPETEALKNALIRNEFNQELIQLWRRLDVAIMGVGSPLLKGNDTWRQFYGEDVLRSLRAKEIVGDVVSRFYAEDGVHVESELDRRIIGIEVDDLKNTEYRIGVAESLDKVTALIGALKGKYINVLVTTEETANSILRFKY
ncbi:sugar-binding transcriptional regulator [Enterococcus sp. MMGLQ5-2]|nr:sugar-binding transcriptional regulator [Enterococcus sp. MMGLQ5-2]MBS7584293.1 sugar-binding transcriptional regulator [Enterococcus sp. MMGLQ5-1]NPD12149.1 sugar-binding transcriptional regulator [Enterococcus sp. MMGLQ5-1]NPD36721.1 sugar-binding transcriptional regulator [Enterococcus sp. MMGLQ5-2]